MTLNSISDIISFPVLILLEGESFTEVFDSSELLLEKFGDYKIEQISSDKVSNHLTVKLFKSPTLEDLGFSFEAGM